MTQVNNIRPVELLVLVHLVYVLNWILVQTVVGKVVRKDRVLIEYPLRKNSTLIAVRKI